MREEDRTQLVFVISGVKNSGKTTMVERLIPLLSGRGLKVATVKHDGHDYEADVPGTDSYRHFAAGAVGTAIFSPTKFSLVKRTPGMTEEDMIRFFPEADLVLLEGFKWTGYPKIEIVRQGNSALPVCDPKTVRAIATDFLKAEELPEEWKGIPVMDMNHLEELCDVICQEWLYAKKQNEKRN